MSGFLHRSIREEEFRQHDHRNVDLEVFSEFSDRTNDHRHTKPFSSGRMNAGPVTEFSAGTGGAMARLRHIATERDRVIQEEQQKAIPAQIEGPPQAAGRVFLLSICRR